ncbi:MAG: M4 family metallopeptidase, partial [Salibacteraceae bacterium]
SDWTMAEDAYSDIQFRRSFIDPKSSYMHYLNENCDIWTIGQADTYEGEFWEDNDCDAGGIHINAGVQNHWFYLLSEGGSGSNDNEDSYFVNGIGPDAAGSIALLNMMTLDESAQFEDARDNALAVSVAIYGDLCSVESFECARAWHAVGVGEPIECEGLGIKNEALSSIKLFPNPSSTEVTIANIKDMNAKLTVTNLLGSTILAHELKIGENTINVSQWSKGTYFFQIGSINGESRTLEFIKL